MNRDYDDGARSVLEFAEGLLSAMRRAAETVDERSRVNHALVALHRHAVDRGLIAILDPDARAQYLGERIPVAVVDGEETTTPVPRTMRALVYGGVGVSGTVGKFRQGGSGK